LFSFSYACNSSDPYFKRYIGTAGDCYVQGAPEYNCNQIVYGWTPGAPALKLPTEAGFRVNDPSDPLSIMNFMVRFCQAQFGGGRRGFSWCKCGV
jgi:hypothetical protein